MTYEETDKKISDIQQEIWQYENQIGRLKNEIKILQSYKNRSDC